MKAPMFGMKLAKNTRTAHRIGQRHAERQQQHQREHRGEQTELRSDDDVAPHVASELRHAADQRGCSPKAAMNRDRNDVPPASA